MCWSATDLPAKRAPGVDHGEVVSRLFTHWPDPVRRVIWDAVGGRTDKGMRKGSALIVEHLSATNSRVRYLPPLA